PRHCPLSRSICPCLSPQAFRSPDHLEPVTGERVIRGEEHDSIDCPENAVYLQMDELFLLSLPKRSVLDAGRSRRFPHTC
ncbi:hypothetical protein CH063_12693, partial [Colletotrichum higginsianum]